ncbi:myosin heavy chain, muscle-like, partial [Penaeus japonicus]|uniref:myosin heavy chain, muscle-like n=1 Tax=Penaeus japonicus TaxID=27405 RepID=UPI001C715E1E
MPGHIVKSTGPDPDPSEWLYVSREQKVQDQSKPYDPKKSCWVPSGDGGFLEGEILGTKDDILTVLTKGGDTKTFKKDQVTQVNPPKYEKCEDMSNLTYLNDASVLYNLKTRYQAKLIYTYSGLFCIAVNPYKRFPIYTNRTVKIYQGKRRNEVPPHLFAIADGAYMNMLQNAENQSMLITGESGAGKTENTKKVLSYFANVGASTKKDDNKPNLEDQIVQTNPVLEAFGNAKTTRNDNSSRFGKFIRIHFGPNGKLSGADIEVYLLEKARVISQQPLERSYHIFYQLMSDQVKEMKSLCFLSNNIYDYHYVSQGKVTVPSIDDKEEMEFTHNAFGILNFGSEEQDNCYMITAAVMHMGEMKFKQRGREEQAEPDGEEVGEVVGKLLGIDGSEMYKNLCKPKIKVGTEFVTQGRNVNQVNYSVGALSKAMFDRLFKWLVKKCNQTLETGQKRVMFIGVLDIAGFEIFDFNGFEQICINFCNEKLQQFFNHHMFVLEQEEYKKQAIDWVFVDFGMDLQACIDLFEKKLGLLAILEEESMFPKATDKTFEEKLKANHLGKSPCFIKHRPTKPGQAGAHFAIVHYAGTVPYNITGWLEKNKDPLNDTAVDQIKKASNSLIVELFADHPGQSGGADAGAKGGRGKGSKSAGGFKTVSSGYRDQLNSLMTTLNATYPHFIRCIVPNETKTPGAVDPTLIMHQLTCNGVLEGIRICRKGFPNRMMYPDFSHRYAILASKAMSESGDAKKATAVCLETIKMEPENYRLGTTKVFFRAGVLGQLEEIRDDRLAKVLSWLQAWFRGYISRIQYKKLQEQRVALIVVQRNLRKYLKLRNWPWYRMWQKVKPLLNVTRVEDEMRALEEKAAKAQEDFEREAKLRREIEDRNLSLLEEKNSLMLALESTKGNVSDHLNKQAKLQRQKTDLEGQLNCDPYPIYFQGTPWIIMIYKSSPHSEIPNFFLFLIFYHQRHHFEILYIQEIRCSLYLDADVPGHQNAWRCEEKPV